MAEPIFPEAPMIAIVFFVAILLCFASQSYHDKHPHTIEVW
jgi:hypothetical protein